MNKKCNICNKYYESKSNACNSKMLTINCGPGNKNLWYSRQLPNGLDPVLSNIYNGCWLCNNEPAQSVNSKLCNRNFYDGYTEIPFHTKKKIETENILKNMHIKSHMPRYHYL